MFKRRKETDQHKPRRHPRRRCWHASSQARGLSVRLSLCSVRLCPYRASLPMMTPITKKSTQNASTRVLRPSSLTAVVAMVEEEWAGANGVTFLFRRPSSSCDEDKESEIQIRAYKLTFNLLEFVTPLLNDSLSKIWYLFLYVITGFLNNVYTRIIFHHLTKSQHSEQFCFSVASSYNTAAFKCCQNFLIIIKLQKTKQTNKWRKKKSRITTIQISKGQGSLREILCLNIKLYIQNIQFSQMRNVSPSPCMAFVHNIAKLVPYFCKRVWSHCSHCCCYDTPSMMIVYHIWLYVCSHTPPRRLI